MIHSIEQLFKEKFSISVKQDHKSLEDQNQELSQISDQFEYKDLLVGPEMFVQLNSGKIMETYQYEKLLGQGAYGDVFLAIHQSTKIKRAIKRIFKQKIQKDDQQKTKLFAEVDILRNLDHPHIVKLYEIFEDKDYYYLITEYVSGGELFDKICALNHFSEKTAALIMKQLFSSLQYLHGQNITHRDLKPENIIVEEINNHINIKLIDFGGAVKIEKGQYLTKRIGTPYYVAPEVLKRQYTEKCDMWSSGVILFILLCGYPPFNGDDDSQIIQSIQKGVVKFDAKSWAQISDGAKNLIIKLLNMDPQKRLNANEAYNDPWIQNNTSETIADSAILRNLAEFNGKNKLKAAIKQLIVTQVMNAEEMQKIRETFESFDQNGDGKLTKEEIIQGYTKIGKDPKKIKEIVDTNFPLVDINNTGEVHFTGSDLDFQNYIQKEFIIAAERQENIFNKDKLTATFRIFDTKNHGYITREDLKHVMGGLKLNDTEFNKIFDHYDKNHDGKIMLDEFLNLFVKKTN